MAMITYDPKNWLAIVLRVRGTIFPRIAARTLHVALVAAVLVVLRERGIINLEIPGAAHAMVGVALGLLLVFRTNASYDRYWEGRKLLGGLTNKIRNLRRQASAYLGAPSQREIGRLGRLWLAAVSRSLHNQQIEAADLGTASAAEKAVIVGAVSPATAIAALMTAAIRAEVDGGRLAEERLRLFDATLSELIDNLGGAERIVRTPVPFAYAHHIKAFLTLFCLSAPLALLGGMGVLTPLAAAIVAFALYGIDEIGVEIEDPFGDDPNDLPMEEIFAALANVLRELEP